MKLWVSFEKSKKYLLVFTTGMIILTAAINLFAPLNPAYNCEGYTKTEKTAKGTQIWNSASSVPLGAGAALLMYAAINKIQWWTFDEIDTRQHVNTIHNIDSLSETTKVEWWAPKVFGRPIKLINKKENMLYLFAATLVLIVMTSTSLGAHNDEENSRCKHPTHEWNKVASWIAWICFAFYLALLFYQLSAD